MTRRLKYEVLEQRVVLSTQSPLPEEIVAAPAAVSPLEAESPPLAAAVPIDQWVHSLVYQQFNQLLPEHVPYLTTQQVASIPEIYWFSQISAASRAVLSAQQVQALNVRDVTLQHLTAQQVNWLTVSQIRSLTLFDFKYLSASQTPNLTPAQIATIPDPGPFAEWSPAARAALTTSQVQALRVSTVRLHLLTPQQVSWLTVAQIQSLERYDFKFLSPTQVPNLTPAQVGTIPDPGLFVEWSAAARAALTLSQVQALRVATVRLELLTPQQVAWLTVAQIQSLTLPDFEFLSPSQVPSLTPAQIATIPDPGPFAEWSPAARAALTISQVQALRVVTVRLELLTSQQVSWLTVAQIQSLTLPDFEFLSPSQVPSLTPAQIATIPDPWPLTQWSPGARAALTMPQVQALRVSTVRLDQLTAQQVSWLTVGQIRSLTLFDFKYLSASQTPYLTATQIATIPDPGPFSAWSAPARAALTITQVQALRVSTVRLDQLTPQQVSWLTVAQIQSLGRYDFKFLSPAQIPSLTPAQVGTIPDPGLFIEWTAAARAALTTSQVQALKVSTVRLDLLTPQQVSWLTVAQVQSLFIYDFKFLTAGQVPWLTPAQIATIPDPGPFAEWSAPARAALTMPQVQVLKVATVRLNLLTPQQTSWLTVAQVQSLTHFDFKYLLPAQTPYLTPAQIGSIPTPGSFGEWPAVSRAALTSQQIPFLATYKIGLSLLTTDQVGWLKRYQIQSLQRQDFAALRPFQIPHLTPAQIATIPDPGLLAMWTPEARAALTLSQIPALQVSTVHLHLLTAQQVGWLTTAQVQSLSLQDFKYLSPSQIPLLTIAQVATIPDPGPISEWTAASRAALTAPQIQALNVSSIRLNWFTPQQVSWLTVGQIQSLSLYDFKYLSPAQIPSLTPAQIASIPDPGPFVAWSPAARAALTAPQIRALNVADVWINLLTPQQVSFLTTAQIAALRWEDFFYLGPSQIQYVPPQQFATIPTGFLVRSLPDELQTNFTRAQLLALSPQKWAEYNSAILVPPSDYMPAVDVPVVNGMPATHLAHQESDRVLNLVPVAAATHVTVASGNWSSPTVWRDGLVPVAGAKVVISSGTVVRFDAFQQATAAINTLRIDGTLTFSTTSNTQLAVDTLVVTETGKLHIGTSAAPILPNVAARIVIADAGPINKVWDPYLLSRGVLSMGEVRMYGKTVTPYASLATAPVRGATQLILTQVPTNWKVGDAIVLTGTHPNVIGNQSEELIIRAINGSSVTVDPLQYDHVPPAGYGLSVYAANFSRNIELVAADSSVLAERPHLMFLHNPNVDIANINVTGFGRTNKDAPINDAVVVNGVLQPGTGLNQRARYAMHFHHTGVNPAYAPAVVRGSVINGSPGWGYVNHSSNVIMENNVAYEALGAGFAAEDGNEIGVMRGNLSMNSYGSGDHLQSREFIHDFGHGGHGFWLQGPGVKVIDNIAAGNGDAAFLYFTSSTKTQFDAVNLSNPSLAAGLKTVPVGAVPLNQFTGNVALTSKSGLEIWFNQTRMMDGQTVIDGFTAWNMRASGIDLRYVGRMLIRNSVLLGDLNSFRGFGVGTNQETGDIVLDNLRIEGFATGIIAPPRRANVILGGTINAVIGISITGANDTVRSLNILGNPTFKTATPSQLGFRQQYSIYADGEVDFSHRSLAAMLAPDRIYYSPSVGALARLYFAEQAAGYVPFPSDTATGYVPDEYLDLTNEELRENFGVSLDGGYPPSDSVTRPGVRALLDFTPES